MFVDKRLYSNASNKKWKIIQVESLSKSSEVEVELKDFFNAF
jgi:hypothetical protein